MNNGNSNNKKENKTITTTPPTIKYISIPNPAFNNKSK